MKEFFILFFILNLLLIPTDVKGIDTAGVMITLDKESYSPFSRVNISVISSASNSDSMKTDKVYADIRTKNANLTGYELSETDSDSGNFTGYITLSGPNGITEGKGPFDGKLAADRGEELMVSFTSLSGEQITARAEVNYHIARIFFEKNSYREGDLVRAILIDEDLNLDPEKPDIVHEFFLTSTFMRGLILGIVPELGVNNGMFAAGGKAFTHSGGFGVVLRPDGETIVAFYHDTTLPKPYSLVGNTINQTEGTWLFAVVPFLGTVPTIKPAPLFYGNYTEGMGVPVNFVMKTESSVQDLKFLKYERKLEFTNVSNNTGIVELQIPREAFNDISSVSVNHTNTDFTLNKNTTHFNVKINYPEGASKVEIFDLDTETSIVFHDPGLVDQQGNDLKDISVDSQVLIESQITNSQTKTQPFAYIVQIKDKNGVTVSLSWLTGELPAQDSLRAARSWMPEESGEYTIETFLWNSLETPLPPLPLAPSKNIEVQIIA